MTRGCVDRAAPGEEAQDGPRSPVKPAGQTARRQRGRTLFRSVHLHHQHVQATTRNTLLMPLAKAQVFTGAQNHVSTILVYLQDREAGRGRGRIAERAGLRGPDVAQDERAHRPVRGFSPARTSWSIYLIVLGITSTVVTNTLVMAVFEPHARDRCAVGDRYEEPPHPAAVSWRRRHCSRRAASSADGFLARWRPGTSARSASMVRLGIFGNAAG